MFYDFETTDQESLNDIMEILESMTSFQPNNSDEYQNPGQFQQGSHNASSAPNEYLNHIQETSEQPENLPNCPINDLENVQFSCEDCLQIFSDLQLLLSHICSHSNGTLNQSEQSEQSCSTSLSSTVFNPEKPFSCQHCDKSFDNRDHLVNHERIHTGESQHTCEECGLSFTFKSKLITHYRIHTGEKPYTCTDCGTSFRRQSHLNVHNRIHTGEEPYTCNECGKYFRHKHVLNNHKCIPPSEIQVVIQPYECEKCGKSYATRHGLTRHDRRHTGVKPHKCQQCEQSFIRSDLLHKHFQRHHTMR